MFPNRLQQWLTRASATARGRRRKGKRSAKVFFRSELERLEDRTMPSVTFTPAPPAVPLNIQPDMPLNMSSYGGPIEPHLTVDPNDPAIVAVSTQGGIRISTDGGATYSGTVAYADPAAARFGNFGDTCFSPVPPIKG
jgi:hypothetical protein